MDSADELARVIAKAINDGCPVDSQGQRRVDHSVILTALATITGEVIASAPADKADEVVDGFSASVRDFVERNRGKTTWISPGDTHVPGRA